jgi:hypothetical protein
MKIEMLIELRTIAPVFKEQLERISWANTDDLITYNSIMKYEREHGGITFGQERRLNKLYTNFKRKNGGLK